MSVRISSKEILESFPVISKRLSLSEFDPYSSADMCLNCSLSVKSTKIGMMTVFKRLKKIGYGAIAKTTVKGHLKGSLKTAAILNRK